MESNSTHSNYDTFMTHSFALVQWIHLVRGLIAILACIPNTLVIFLYWKASRRNPSKVRTRVNYSVVNLLTTNLIYCIVLCTYSFLKRFSGGTLTLTTPCLVITWFTVFASFEPLWGMWLVAFCRVIYFSRNDRLDRLASRTRLILLRLCLFLLDICATSVIILGEEEDAVQKHCNYQLMLDNSKKYLAYSFFILICLVVMGVSSFVLRLILRIVLLRQVHVGDKVDPEGSQNAITGPSSDPQIPSAVWEKPKLILIASIVVTLFLVPRIAFFCDYRPFWLVSTLCPAMMALVLPLAFLWTTKEFRNELRILVLPSKRRKPVAFGKALNPYGKK